MNLTAGVKSVARFWDIGLMDIGRGEVINILVACNNRDKEWCPFGEDDCECESYTPREIEDDESISFTCTDKYYDERECALEVINEEGSATKKVLVDIKNTSQKILPQYLVKDLLENEHICPVCHGLGMRIENNVYGIKGDTSKAGQREHFPYKHQSLSFCRSCFNGVQELCEFCGEPYKQPGYRHCDCEGFQRAEEEKRIKKWEETVAKAKEVQESDVDTMLYCEEFDAYYSEVDDFFEEYEREYSDEGVYTKPERLWVCSVTEISLDADSTIESACDKLHEDASGNCDYKSLQKLLDGWCKEQTETTTYYPCYKEYVKIDWSRYEKNRCL